MRQAWDETLSTSREELLNFTPREDSRNVPIMLTTSSNRGLSLISEVYKKFRPYSGRSSVTRDISNTRIMMANKKPPYVRDILVRANISKPVAKTALCAKARNHANIAVEFPNQGPLPMCTTALNERQSHQPIAKTTI